MSRFPDGVPYLVGRENRNTSEVKQLSDNLLRKRHSFTDAAEIVQLPAPEWTGTPLRELGRIERTLFTLDQLLDPQMRRRVREILNKGELRNDLARAVCLNWLGEIRDRTFEGQRHRACGLIW